MRSFTDQTRSYLRVAILYRRQSSAQRCEDRLCRARCFMYVQGWFTERCLMLGHLSKDSRQTWKSKILEHRHVPVTDKLRDMPTDSKCDL